MQALLVARFRTWRRQLWSHAFELFVLGPIVLGGAIAIADRYLMVGTPYLASLLAEPVGARRLGLLAALIFSAVAGAGVFRELYGDRGGSALLDILPTSDRQRLVLTAWAAPVAALPAALLWWGGAAALEHWTGAPGLPLGQTPFLAWLGFLALILLDHLLIQLAVRLRLLRAVPLAIGLGALLALWIFDPGSPLLFFWSVPGDLLAATWANAAGTAQTFELKGLLIHLLLTSTLGALLFLRYRRADLDHAQGLRSVFRAWRLLPTARSATRALVRRDLLLVLRRFSPLVPLAFAVSLGLVLLLPLLVARSGLPPLALARTFAAGSVLAVAAWVALLPYLLAGQLRTFWLESSLGTTASDLGRAKATTALILAAPPALVSALLAFLLLPQEAGRTAICILCAALTLAISMGLTIWETPFEPAIGLLYGLLVGGAIAALFVLAPAGWPYWLAGYVYLAFQLLGRVRERVASLEQPR